MKSMTGYGISQWKSKDCCVEVVVQSYNGKYFESRVQSPAFYNSLEGELRKELQKKFIRGFISLSITRSPLWPVKKTTVKWNKEQALKWKSLYKKMAVTLKMKYEVNLPHLAQQPGVLEVTAQPALVSVQEKNKVKVLVRRAVDLCSKEREREGKALQKDFQKNLNQLMLSLKKVKSHAVRQSKGVGKKIESKVGAIDDIEGKKAIQEVTSTLINRMDINEEVSRMEEHIRAFRSLIAVKGVIGKKMSFYLQEMIREMNTVGAKAQDFKLTKEVVQIKTFIERMREQVQNIE
jgi:uncharacterized protein (TIGR00255 family)